jgi:hypothetical protein
MRPYLSFLFSLLCLLSFYSMGEAQSGRRSQPNSSSVSPAPKVEAEPAQEAPVAASKPEQPKQKLIAGMDELSRSINIPLYMSNAVWEGFLERFRKVSSLNVTTQDMRRKDAVERAKKETESFVVLLELETQYMDSGAGVGQVNSNDLQINYTIFSPVTGKVKSSGRVYVRQSSGILSGRLPTSRAGESQLYEAGREAANRVLSVLNMGGGIISH